MEEEADELLLDPKPKDLIPEAEAKKRNWAWEDFVKKEVHEISKEVPVVNKKFMEPIASRHQGEVTKCYKGIVEAACSGIPVYRLHSDRERSLRTKALTSGVNHGRFIKL